MLLHTFGTKTIACTAHKEVNNIIYVTVKYLRCQNILYYFYINVNLWIGEAPWKALTRVENSS